MLGSAKENLESTRILFVDDSRLMRYAARQFLRNRYDVVTASDGEEAWRLIAKDPNIQLVFTDLMMPVMDGQDLIRNVRASDDPKIRDLPILVVTGNDETRARKLALQHGATDLIRKPFSANDLTDSARKHLVRPEVSVGRLPFVEREDVPKPSAEHSRLDTNPDEFLKQLQQTHSFHLRRGLPLALIHVRLDDFQSLYFGMGQHWAESALRNVGRYLEDQIRTEDVVCRSHLSAFSLILLATDRAGAWILANRLRRRLNGARIRFPGKSISISVSVAVQIPKLENPKSPKRLLVEGLAQLDQQFLARY